MAREIGFNYGYDDNSYIYGEGWLPGYGGKDKLAQWFRDYLNRNGQSSEFIDSMSDKELESYLTEYAKQTNDFLGNQDYSIDASEIARDLARLSWNNDMPQRPNYNDVYNDAVETINRENAEVEKLYDNLLSQQTTNFNQQLSDLNKSYNNMSSQILSNNYINNRQLMDTATSELSKSRRNALEAGASAGLRLANNINTMLSVQNKQAQQSLETSNNLAQMLLNQQQAASGIRGDYYNSLAQNTANKANLRKGTSERISQYANSQFDTQDRMYENNMKDWEDSYYGRYGENTFGDAYLKYQKGKKYGNLQ